MGINIYKAMGMLFVTGRSFFKLAMLLDLSKSVCSRLLPAHASAQLLLLKKDAWARKSMSNSSSFLVLLSRADEAFFTHYKNNPSKRVKSFSDKFLPFNLLLSLPLQICPTLLRLPHAILALYFISFTTNNYVNTIPSTNRTHISSYNSPD